MTNRMMLAAGLALAAEVAFGACGRVAVLDMGLEAGVTNRFGCASAPAAFVRALGGTYDVRVVPHSAAIADGAFDTARTDLLVIPSGALFPQDAAKAIVDYLKKGGLLLTAGGYAFDEPLVFDKGKWRLSSEPTLPSPVCTNLLVLPPPEAWTHITFPGSLTEVTEERAPDGHRAMKISTKRLLRYNLGTMSVSPKSVAGSSALGFRAKADPALKTFRVEIAERDGTRWMANIPASADWKEYGLSWDTFMFHGDSPTKKTRGKAGDHVRFHEAARISFGVTHGNDNPLRVPHALWVADVKTGDDPLAAKRTYPEHQAWINTRNYPRGWRDEPRPDQIGVFSPAYRLEGVAGIRNDPATADLFAPFARTGDFGGWDASAMLTPKINGHAKNRAAYRPVLACRDEEGNLRGRAACLVYHYDGIFKGSSWALFGIDNRDLFASPEADGLLRDMVDALFRRVYLAVTAPVWTCYRPGETATFATHVKNFSPGAASGTVVFTLADEQGEVVRRVERPFSAASRTDQRLTLDWPVPADAKDFYRLKAELVMDGRTVDRETTAIAVWNAQTIASGPKIGRNGTFFTVNGRRQFLVGAQMFLARQASHTSGSALRFYDDFKAMNRASMTISRNFFYIDDKMPEPERTRLVRLMDACVLLSQKFSIVNYFTPCCGNVIPLDAAGQKAEGDLIAFFAKRYRDVPGFIMDVRNEPRIERKAGDTRSPKELDEVFLAWSRATAEGAHRGNKDVIAATGWSQGWGGGPVIKDPPTASMPFDFTDCHYYGDNENHISEIKKIDHRVWGKPAVMGEFGCAFNPMRIKYSDSFATIEEASRRYRCQAVRTFGCGYAFMCHYGWTDLIEGLCTFALCHWDGNPRPVVDIYTNISRTFSRLTPVENPPDTVLLISETRLEYSQDKWDALVVYRAVCNALAWHGVNFSVLPESERARVPASVKLTICSDEFKDAKFIDPVDGPAILNKEIGSRIRAAGVASTRLAGDPDTLETYRVPGKGATAWLFWNGDEKRPVTVERDGHRLTIGAERGGYLQVSDDGRAEVSTEL